MNKGRCLLKSVLHLLHRFILDKHICSIFCIKHTLTDMKIIFEEIKGQCLVRGTLYLLDYTTWPDYKAAFFSVKNFTSVLKFVRWKNYWQQQVESAERAEYQASYKDCTDPKSKRLMNSRDDCTEKQLLESNFKMGLGEYAECFRKTLADDSTQKISLAQTSNCSWLSVNWIQLPQPRDLKYQRLLDGSTQSSRNDLLMVVYSEDVVFSVFFP